MKKRKILVVGASGQMGRLAILEAPLYGYEIMPFGIIGPEDPTKHVHGRNGEIIDCLTFDKITPRMLKEKPIVVDFTHKSVVNQNWERYYEKLKLPLIVGTIGLKKEHIISSCSPVIIGSPNFALELANIMNIFSKELPRNFLKNILIGVTESHQGPDPKNGLTGKTEFSGTADRMIESFENAGGKILYKTSVRDPKVQSAMGIKPEYLSGHAWHTYHFMSPNQEWGIKSVEDLSEQIIDNVRYGTHWMEPEYNIFKDGHSGIFQVWNKDKTFQLRVEYDPYNVWLSHNINGRKPYIDGLFESVLPELEKILVSGKNEVRDMFDIL